MTQVWIESTDHFKCYVYITESQIKVLEELGKYWESVDLKELGLGVEEGLEYCVVVPDKHNYCQEIMVWLGTLANPFEMRVSIDVAGQVSVTLGHQAV